MKRRFIAVGDNHGDLINKADEKAFLDFCADFKPHDRIHLGDNWDFRNLRKGVDPEEELDDPEPDLTAGFLFLERFKPTVFLCGNHDHRPWRMEKDTRGIVRKYARDGIKQIKDTLSALKCRFLPYDIEDGEYQHGEYSMVHGYTCNKYSVSQHATIYRRSIIMGHLHRNEILTAQCTGGISGMCVGGLGDHKRMSYSRQRPATLAWGKGWSFGYWNDRTNKTEAFPIFKQGDLWLTKALG